MNRQYIQQQPQRRRVQRVVQQHQPQQQRPHPTPKAAKSGMDGLAWSLLTLNAVLIAWAVLA